MKIIRYFLVGSLLAVSYIGGTFLGKKESTQKICGDCSYVAGKKDYQVCVGEYIVFECKKGDWVKTYERELASSLW